MIYPNTVRAGKYILLLMFMNVAALCAQTFKGFIFSTQDSLPIQGVQLYSAKNFLLAQSKIDGSFEIPIQPHQNIIFKHSSYEYIEINFDSLPANIYLNILNIGLSEVVVSAGKREQRINETTVSIDILKPVNLIENSNITKLDAAMDNMPGVNIINGQANIRGGSGFSYGAGSRVLMLVDGLPMISADANDIKWDALPLENIQQVEVIKGASSALYGSGALNGIINIKTASPGKTPVTKLNVFQGGYDSPRNPAQKFWTGIQGTSGTTLSHARKYKDLDITVAGYILNDQGYRVSENFLNKRISAQLKYQPRQLKGLQFGISMLAFQSNFGNFLYWKNADSALWPASGSNSQYRNNRYSIDPSIIYQSKKGWKYNLLNRIYITDNHNITNKNQNSLATLNYHEFQVQKSFATGRWKIIPTAGIVASRQKIQSDSIYGMHQGNNYGLYIQTDIKWRKTNISVGIRREWNKADTLAMEGLPVYRFGISQQLGKATYLRTSWGTGYRFPSMAERFTQTSAGSINVFPNPGIQSETGSSFELGIKQGLKINRWRGYIDLAAFNTEYKNMIDFTFGYYPPVIGIFNPKYLGFKPTNVIHAQIKGIESSIAGSGNIGKVKLDILGGYTFINPQYLGLNKDSMDQIVNGNILKYRFRHTWKANADISYKKFTLGFSYRFNSHMLKVDTIFYQVIPGIKEYREKHNSGYGILDLRLSYQRNEWSKFTLVIKNTLNEEYIFMAGNMGSPRAFTLQYQLILK